MNSYSIYNIILYFIETKLNFTYYVSVKLVYDDEILHEIEVKGDLDPGIQVWTAAAQHHDAPPDIG